MITMEWELVKMYWLIREKNNFGIDIRINREQVEVNRERLASGF